MEGLRIEKTRLVENPELVDIPEWSRYYKVKREPSENGYRDFLYFAETVPKGEPGWSQVRTHSKMEVNRDFDESFYVFRWSVRYIED